MISAMAKMGLQQVGVIGGGAWGTALAAHCARMGHQTLIYAREPEVVQSINEASVNETFLKVQHIIDSSHFSYPQTSEKTCREM